MAWKDYIHVNTNDISEENLQKIIEEAIYKTSELFGLVAKKEAIYDPSLEKYYYKLSATDVSIIQASSKFFRQGDLFLFDNAATLLVRQKISSDLQLTEPAKEYFTLLVNYLVLLKREELNNELGSNTVLGTEMTYQKQSLKPLIEEYKEKLKNFEKNYRRVVLYTGKIGFERSYKKILG